jgi:hypothetical protein
MKKDKADISNLSLSSAVSYLSDESVTQKASNAANGEEFKNYGLEVFQITPHTVKQMQPYVQCSLSTAVAIESRWIDYLETLLYIDQSGMNIVELILMEISQTKMLSQNQKLSILQFKT